MAASVDFAQIDELRRTWTDRRVSVQDHPDYRRFSGQIGRVVTINCSGRALVDFADGAWYDIPLSVVQPVDDPALQSQYDATVNSAQPRPARQG